MIKPQSNPKRPSEAVREKFSLNLAQVNRADRGENNSGVMDAFGRTVDKQAFPFMK